MSTNHIPVYVCPVCRREYNEELNLPLSLPCGCAMCHSCLTVQKKRKESTPAYTITCAENHPVPEGPNSGVVPSKLLLQLVNERRECCPVHPSKRIEIWCPACASGLCVSCHMGDEHMKRCASIQQLEISAPAAQEAVQRRALEMLNNFADAEARVANAPLPPLEAYSAEALMNRMRELAVQAREAFDDKLFEIVSANLELALGHQISSAYKTMEDRHQRLVLLQHATRQIQDAESLAHAQPAAAAARLRRFQIDPEIGKPLCVMPPMRLLEGIKIDIEPIWRDVEREMVHVLEDETLTTLAVAEALNHRVKIVRSDGSFVRHLGTAGRPGSGELEFSGVRGIALLGDGQTLALSEMENHRVKLLKIDGTFICNLGTGKAGSGENEFNGPRGVAVLGDGLTLAVCDFGNNRVKLIAADGTLVRHIGAPGCKAGDGDNEFNKPIAVAVLGDGVTLAVTDVENARVKIVHSDGTFLRHIGGGLRTGKPRGFNELDFNVPLGICVLGDGVTLAVCDSENHRIKIVRGDDGRFVRHIGSGIPGQRAGDFHGPCGIATLSDGSTLAVTDFENNRVKLIRSDGSFIRHIGGNVRESTNGSSSISFPAGHMVLSSQSNSGSSASSPRRGNGKGERDFGGPWGVVCLDFHPGSPMRSGLNRINPYAVDVSRTPSAAAVTALL